MGRLLNRSVRIQKRKSGKNALGERVQGYDEGRQLAASHEPLSEAERLGSGLVEAVYVARFTVRFSAYVAGIGNEDRLSYGGEDWRISGIREIGRQWVEITAWRK